MTLDQNKRNIRWGLYLMSFAMVWGSMHIELIDETTSDAYRWFALVSLSVFVFSSCRSGASARSFWRASGDGPAGGREVMGPGAESHGAADACHIGGRRRAHAPDGSAVERGSWQRELCLEDLGR
jgi:hypothetical protein